jgi:hypothetical protein
MYSGILIIITTKNLNNGMLITKNTNNVINVYHTTYLLSLYNKLNEKWHVNY